MARSFAEMNDTSHHENLLVVDSLNLAFRYKHSNTRNFAAKYLETVRSLAKSYECGTIIITADLKGSSYREGIYPEYKGNRRKLREKQTEQEKEDFEDFFEDYIKTLKLLEEAGFPILQYRGVEADDIAAFLVKYHSTDFGHTWLISSDKDWDLLISDKVSRFSYVTRKEISIANWEQHYDYTSEQHISVKVLQGDSGDNVPGVPGIGPKRAITLLRDYDSAMDIYDALPINQKYKHIQNLNEFGDQLLLNYELMDLLTYCDEAIGQDNIQDIENRL